MINCKNLTSCSILSFVLCFFLSFFLKSLQHLPDKSSIQHHTTYLFSEYFSLLGESSRNEEVGDVCDGPVCGIRVIFAVCEAWLFGQMPSPWPGVQSAKNRPAPLTEESTFIQCKLSTNYCMKFEKQQPTTSSKSQSAYESLILNVNMCSNSGFIEILTFAHLHYRGKHLFGMTAYPHAGS